LSLSKTTVVQQRNKITS